MSSARSSASRRRQAGSILKNVNLAKVRSAIGVTIALALLALGLGAGRSTRCARAAPTRVDVWLLAPAGHERRAAGETPAFAGLMSAGLGTVPAEQTYLDITQGNRVFDSLYDTELPPLGRDCSPGEAVVDRAESAPADIVPGLLDVDACERPEWRVRWGVGASCTFSAPQPRTAAAASPKKLSGAPPRTRHPHFEVRSAIPGALSSLMRVDCAADDLLIAVARPPPPEDEALPIGIAGRGFDGNLTSDSTRLDGYVLSTDVAPTILDRFGVAIPDAMSGQPIDSEGERRSRRGRIAGERMAAIPQRRGPVIGFALLAGWLLALAATAALGGARRAAVAVRVAGLAVVYLPAPPARRRGARRRPGRPNSCWRSFGAPLLGAADPGGCSAGYRALAVASAVTVVRLRGRRDRRLAAHLALAARAQPGPRRALLRDRQRARGVARRARRRRDRCGAGRLLRPAPRPRAGAWAFLAVGLVLRLRLRRRPLRRRRRRGDRAAAGRGGRGRRRSAVAPAPCPARRPRPGGGAGRPRAGRPGVRRRTRT